MSRFTLDMIDGSESPKRGDLLQSNVGGRRARTWFVLAVHPLKPTKGGARSRLWIERWWEVDADLRMRLYRSAERRGGQRVIAFTRYPAKRRKVLTLDQYCTSTTAQEGRLS